MPRGRRVSRWHRGEPWVDSGRAVAAESISRTRLGELLRSSFCQPPGNNNPTRNHHPRHRHGHFPVLFWDLHSSVGLSIDSLLIY